MGVTSGSWWMNRLTGQKLAVADQRIMRNQSRREDGRTVHYGLGRDPDRYACYLEGKGLYLAWLTEDELRAGWKLLRLKPDFTGIPGWIQKPKQFNDFLLYDRPICEIPDMNKAEPIWVSVQRIRSGWLCLSGMKQYEFTGVRHERQDPDGKVTKTEGYFNWGLQAYNTLFLPASEAVPRMLPKYETIRLTVYDHIARGGAL